MTSVAIIGAGITGLTAAFRLKEKGIAFTVYEAGSRPGGVIQSVLRNGYLAECGPNTCLETSPKVTALIRDAGLEGRRLDSDPRAESRYLVRGGKPIAMPSSPVGFFKTPLFSFGAKTALLKEPFISRSPQGVEESVADFVVRRLGQEFLDYAINPLVAGVYAGNPAQLSVKHAFPKLLALEQEYGSLIRGQILGARKRKRSGEVSKQNAKKFSFDEGLQVLTDTLAAKFGSDLQLRSAVTRIEQTGNGWKISSRTEEGEVLREHAAVLFAAPAYKFQDIAFHAATRVETMALNQIKYPPVASVVMGFRREDVSHSCSGFGALIPEVEGFNILGVIFSSSLFPNRAPDGHLTLTAYVGGCRNPELALAGEATLRRLVLGDLKKLLGVNGEPTFEHYFVYPKAIPQYEVGYGKVKEAIRAIETAAPGVYFAGPSRDGISLADSIVAGDNIAGTIQTYLSQRTVPTATSVT
jgi:oxygen-dependent protoporphyrinogen oxidase